MVEPRRFPVNPGAANLCLRQYVDVWGDHSSRVEEEFAVAVTSLWDDGFLVQVSQDVNPGNGRRAGAPDALQGQRVGVGRRQGDGVGEHVILKRVTLVSAMFSLQQRNQLGPTGNKKKRVRS